MIEDLSHALQRVAHDITAHGVDLPHQWRDRIQSALGPLNLDALTPETPEELIEAHFALMNARLDDVTTIVFSHTG